ncbi:MAG: amino acid permease [Microbacterium sp.]
MSINAEAVAAETDGHRGTIGVVQGTALYIAAVLGTGLLVLPGIAAEAAGPASIVSVLIVLVLSMPLAGTFGALAARYPDPGGVASYVRRALGPTASRMTGYWFYFGVCAGGPVVAVLGAEYIAAVAGIARAGIPILALTILALGLAANLFGVRIAGWVQFVLTGLLLAVVVGVVAFALPAVRTENFTPFLPSGWGGVGTAVLLFVWAFAGWEVGTHISGEFREPRRVIPIATAIALVLTGASYLLLQIATVGVVGATAGDDAVPLLTLASAVAPGIGPVAVAIVAGIVSLGVLNAYLAAFGKLGASLARNGDLPRWFQRGADPGTVPRRALLLTLAVILVYFTFMVWTDFDLQPFILIHTSNMVAIYAAGMLSAVMILPRRTAGWWMAIVAAVLSAGLLILAGSNLLPSLILAAIAVGMTGWRRWRMRRARSRG